MALLEHTTILRENIFCTNTVDICVSCTQNGHCPVASCKTQSGPCPETSPASSGRPHAIVDGPRQLLRAGGTSGTPSAAVATDLRLQVSRDASAGQIGGDIPEVIMAMDGKFFRRLQTVGDGACAIHSVLGTFQNGEMRCCEIHS